MKTSTAILIGVALVGVVVGFYFLSRATPKQPTDPITGVIGGALGAISGVVGSFNKTFNGFVHDVGGAGTTAAYVANAPIVLAVDSTKVAVNAVKKVGQAIGSIF